MAPYYGALNGQTYSGVCAYSPQRNCMVYGGGNCNPTKLWRLNADRTFTPMPDAPAGCTVGIQQGLLCEDPATGNFLVLSQGRMFELNPTGSGSWKDLGPAPAYVGIPSAPDAVTCTPIAELGVVAYLTANPHSAPGVTFALFKRA